MTPGSALDYLKAMARLASRELREGGDPGGFGGDRIVVERWGLRVEDRRLDAYLKATAGTGIDAFRRADAWLPPAFPACWESALVLDLLCHPRAPSVRGGVVHVASELLQVRALPRDGAFRCRLELDRAEADPRGARLHLSTRTWNASGQLGSESRTVLLVRGRSGRPGGPWAADDPRPEAPWSELAAWKLRGGHGRRFARASGDYNPIHLSRLTALPFGFRRPILHGFCTQAMVAHALIGHRFGGRPECLRHLTIAFRSPVLLPADLRLLIRDGGDGGGSDVFRVEGGRGATYAEGEFTGARPA